MDGRTLPVDHCADVLACTRTEPAGASTYDVSTVSSNWIASTGHTVISAWAAGICPDTIGDDSLSAPLNLGFSFRLGATSFTQLRVSTNGRVQFNNTYCNNGSAAAGNPRTYRNPLPDANFGNVLRIYGADLDVSAAGTITYATTGTAPNRIFVVTWNNVSAWRQGGAQNRGAGTSYNLQIQLHENGDFYFVYGTSDDISEPSNTAMGPAQIGWQIDLKDYALIGTGLPANGTAYRFTLARPYAEYRMDEGSWNGAAGEVADSSGNGRNGSRVASPLTASVVQTIAAGKVCRAMDVPDNGGNSQFDAVNSGVTPSGVGSLGSITFWWRARSSWNGSANYLFDATTQASRLFYLGKRNNGRLRFEITDNASTPVTVAAETANQSVAANTWKHIAVTWRLVTGTSATILNIYLDGALVATASGTTNGQFNASLNTLYIGDNRSSASNGMTGSPTSADGTIDEFRIYPRTLTAADVLSVMAETRATCPSLGASHFLLSHSGHGINCRVEPVTVYALDGLNGLVGTYSGATTLTTQSGRGTWSLISGHGTLADSTPDDGLASYQFVPADGGQAVFGVYYPAGSSPIDIAVYQTDDPTIHDDGTEGRARVQRQRLHGDGKRIEQPAARLHQLAGNNPNCGNDVPGLSHGLRPDPNGSAMWRDRDIHRAAPAFVLERSRESLAGRHECNRQQRYGGMERSCGHGTERHVQPWPGSAFHQVQRRRIDSFADERPHRSSHRDTRFDQCVRS